MLAAAEGKTTCVHYLLYAGASVNCVDRWGGTALNDALRAKHSVIARLLWQQEAELGQIMPPGVPESQVYICLTCSHVSIGKS